MKTKRAQLQGVEINCGLHMILVAEDNDDMRNLVKIILEADGYSLISARDGLEALEAYREYKGMIEIVLTDIEMPRLTGVDLYKQIKDINPVAKVVFLSGYFDPTVRSQLQDWGVRHFIQKPFKAEEILRVVRTAIEEKVEENYKGFT